MPSSSEERELLRQRLSRRRLLKAGAVAAIGAAGVGLAACGEEEGEQPSQLAATAPAVATASPGPIGSPAPGSSSIVSLAGNPQAIAEVAPGTLFFPYFGNVIALLTDDGIVVVDTSLAGNGPHDRPGAAEAHRSARQHHRLHPRPRRSRWRHRRTSSKTPTERGYDRPRIIGHKRVVRPPPRYERMAGWIQFINSIQFGVPIEPGFEPPPPPGLRLSRRHL